MKNERYYEVVEKTAQTLVKASSVFSQDKIEAYECCTESSETSRWAIDAIVSNAKIAEERRSPLCDDTGIPHLILDIGKNREISGDLIDALYEGVKEGLRRLPGRPMAVKGNELRRIDQSEGLYENSDALVPAPLMLRYSDNPEMLKLTVMMQGGGPEIRSKTYRVFHKHNADVVIDEIISWASESVSLLGCSPCTIAIGIGRTHYEASSLMLQAMAEGDYRVQSDYERKITDALNKTKVGALGLGGDCSVLGTFMKIGPQRASGVRIVCMRPCCCFEPRKADIDL